MVRRQGERTDIWFGFRGLRRVNGFSRNFSHLTSGDELKGSESGLQIGGVGLEVVESLGEALLELGGLLPRGAAGVDLVKGRATHVCGGAVELTGW